jgi:hypothetical protein
MGLWTNVGLQLVATAVQTAGANAAASWVDIIPGCGTLASALASGTAYTSLSLNAGLPVALSAGQSLTITNGTSTQTVTTSGPASIGATSIPVNSFTANANYAINVTGVCPTPLATDTALYNGSSAIRVAATAGVAGSNPGESLSAGYFDGTQATAIYMLVGYFGGSTATSTPGTGTLMIEDVQYWSHVINMDTNMYQADSTI